MKVSLEWIRRHVDLPRDLDLAGLSHSLTMRTVEVEGAVNPADRLGQIVVGIILDIKPHPQADMLKVCLVDTGSESPSTIVCGGSNIKVGMHVATALPGAMVRWHGEGEPVQIKPTKLRGVKSDGMICAAAEMELQDLFPAKDDHEILDLDRFPAQAGTPVVRALKLEDIILEIDNKSLTNRPDLWCHYGIARELAAIYRLPLKELAAFDQPDRLPEYPVTIRDDSRCRRYAALEYEGVSNGPSPYWMQSSLFKVGIRPISSLVDITNYVMLDVGQPTHAFDRNMLQGGIEVRGAREGERLTLLDGKNLKLVPDDLMICDPTGPIALAGVMGGAQDSILPETQALLLEIANFEPKGVRRSAVRYQARTESANRNEKGLDTQRVDLAMAAADRLIRQLNPGARLTRFTDCYPVKTAQGVIPLNIDWLSIRLGRSVTADSVAELLAPLGFTLTHQGDDLSITVPTYRATGDVSLKEDVLEEVARMIGYEHFEFIPPMVRLDKALNQVEVRMERAVREYLADQCGMQEVYTYPWVDRQYLEAAGFDLQDCLHLATPPSPEVSGLRPSLVPAMLETAAMNLRYFPEFRVYELTQVFKPGQSTPSEPDEVLPLQWRSLAAALVGPDARGLFLAAKGILENMPRAVMSDAITLKQVEKPEWSDPKAWLNILCGGQPIGALGLVSRQAARQADIKRAATVVFELNLDLVNPLPSRSNRYQPLPLFPLVEQDFSVLLDEAVSWQDVSDALEKTVRKLEFVEEYHGKQVPEGKKSMMFRVTLGSDEGTMTADMIAEKVQAIKKKLVKIGAELRM